MGVWVGRARNGWRALAAVVLTLTLAACSGSGSTASPEAGASAAQTRLDNLSPPPAGSSLASSSAPAFVVQQPFDTPGAVPGISWASVTWTRLPPDSPVSTIRQVIAWRGGYVAVGVAGVWVSGDGNRWTPLNAALPVPAAIVVEVPAGLAALAYQPVQCGAGDPCGPSQQVLPLTAWTSSDGRVWTDRGPAIGLTGRRVISVAGSSGGAVAVVLDGDVPRVVHSTDGVTWNPVSVPDVSSTFPCLNAAFGRGRFLLLCPASEPAVGDIPTRPEWSVDGETWAAEAAPQTADRPALMDRLLVGRNGLMAAGWVPGAGGPEQWWQSADGTSWQLDAAYAPLGSVTFHGGQDQGPQANGVLEADGARFVALGYSEGGEQLGGPAWTSWDGKSWATLAVHGQPDWPALMAEVVVFPTGVLAGGSWGAAA
jgi:hypothetical protein